MDAEPRIETERLVLTFPTARQVDGYYTAILGTTMFDTICWDGPQGPAELHEYWTACRRDVGAGLHKPLNVAIIERLSDEYVGGASLRPVAEDPAIIDLGYAFAPAFHGRGFATEAVGALVDEAFERRGAQRIFANVFVGNQASRHVVEKLGFQLEGTLRRAVCKRGEWLDEWSLAITRPDWEGRREAKSSVE